MRTGLKIAGFAAALAASFGVAFGVGSVIDPLPANAEPTARAGHSGAHSGAGDAAAARDHDSPPGGLQASGGGYTLDVKTPRLEAGRKAVVRFRVIDDAGRPLTSYRPEHDEELHLIVTSHHPTTYRQLRPRRAADGTWTAPVNLPRAGDYRLFADFIPAGTDTDKVVLGADLAVEGATDIG